MGVQGATARTGFRPAQVDLLRSPTLLAMDSALLIPSSISAEKAAFIRDFYAVSDQPEAIDEVRLLSELLSGNTDLCVAVPELPLQRVS